MVIFDTSFIYSFFVKNDVHHKKVIDFLEKNEGEAFFTPLEVVQELLTVVTRKINSKEAIKIGKLILSEDSWITVFKSNEIDFDEGWKTFQKLNPHKFSFVDCLLIGLAKNKDNTIITFDKELLKALA